jgi:geranylgeranyl diphosphate synthase type I
VEDARLLVEPEMRKAVSRLDPVMQRVCGYHLGWLDAEGASTPGGGGKGLRPALAVTSAVVCGGDPARAVPVAVAVELVHNFSLVHDDIMDGDTRRRQRTTVWAEFGVPAGVLAGDALLCLALDVLLADGHDETTGPIARCLVRAVGELVAGQSADLEFERRCDVSLAEGLGMAAAKTSALMSCAASGGALSAGATEHQVELLASFGRHLGHAFQAVDDLLGIWGDPARTGKPALADLRVRKKSLPVVAALASPTAAGDALRDRYRRPDPFEEAELEQVADLVERSGGRLWAERRVRAEVAEAKRCVRLLGRLTPAQEVLGELADFVAGRDR